MPTTQLRPLSLGEILDGAFALYRRHFGVMLGTALVPRVPLLLALAVLPAFVTGPTAAIGSTFNWTYWGFVAVCAPLTVSAWAALVRQVAGAYLGGGVSLRGAFSLRPRAALGLTAMYVLYYAALALGAVFLVAPAIYLLVRFTVKLPAAVLEGCSPVRALGRSRALVRRRPGAVWAVTGVLYAVSIAVSYALTWTLAAFADPAGSPWGLPHLEMGFPWYLAVHMVVVVLSRALVDPLSLAVITLLYFDLRVRNEGLDLELAPAPERALQPVPTG